jgi:hypothetical protein
MIERFLVEHVAWASDRWRQASTDFSHALSYGTYEQQAARRADYTNALWSLRRSERMLNAWRRLKRRR